MENKTTAECVQDLKKAWAEMLDIIAMEFKVYAFMNWLIKTFNLK